MQRFLLFCSFAHMLSGCVSTPNDKSITNADSIYLQSSISPSTMKQEKFLSSDGMPDGFIPPTGAAIQVLIEYTNPATGQTWTAPSGGYTIPEGWIEVNGDPINQ